MKQWKILSLVLALGLGACSKAKESASADAASVVADILQDVPPSVQPDIPTPIPAEPTPIIGEKVFACTVFNKLKNKRGLSHFSWLENTRQGQDKDQQVQWQGYMNIGQTPFAQQLLGERLNYRFLSDSEFKAQVDADCQAHRMDARACREARIAFLTGRGKSLQARLLRQRIEAFLPGLFEAKFLDLSSSLPITLANRLFDSEALGFASSDAILTTHLPLYTGDGSWSLFVDDVHESLQAVANSLALANSDEVNQERACAFMLLQRHWAQLLAIKGYQRPEITSVPNSSDLTKVELLTDRHPTFRMENRVGAFLSQLSGRQLVLNMDQLATYDPAFNPVILMQSIPTGKVKGKDPEMAELADILNFLQASSHSFAFSSPVASWINASGAPVFGDIFSANTTAALPQEMHTVSLGFLNLGFKNVFLRHLVHVNTNGVRSPPGTPVVAAILSTGRLFYPLRSNEISVLLPELMQFAQAVHFTESLLRSFAAHDAAYWAQQSATYAGTDGQKALAKLVGRAVFSAADLDRLLTADERENILLDRLIELKPALLYTLKEMATSRKSRNECARERIWDLRTGIHGDLDLCSKDEKTAVRALIQTLSTSLLRP